MIRRASYHIKNSTADLGRGRQRRLGVFGIAGAWLAVTLAAGAAIPKGPDYTNAIAAEQQRILQFHEAEQSFQEKLRVGRERYNQRQMERAKVVEAMSTQLQNRQRLIIGQSRPALEDQTGQLIGRPWGAGTAALLAIGFIGIAYYLNGQRLLQALAQTRQTISLSPPEPPPVPISKLDEMYHCKSFGANGRGRYTDDGFVVLKGSVCASEMDVPPKGKPAEMRLQLLESGALRPEGETVTFQEDCLFATPSMAAAVLIGKTANGWLEWRTEDGITLETLERLDRGE
jgi:hypothetical protein